MSPAPQEPGPERAGGIDPARSACVLIGVDAYTKLKELTSVRNNLTRLRSALTDKTIWGIAPERLVVVSNPETPQALVRPIREMAEQAEDTLIVYYSGHGLKDLDDDQLYLTLPDSETRRPETAVRFDLVSRALQDPGSPHRKVVILDCCYSGQVLEGMAAVDVGEQIKASVTDVQGLYLMTSTAQDRRALAPRGETYTAFTGELLTILYDGVPDGPRRLDLHTLFELARVRLKKRNRPEPQEQDQNGIGTLPFVRNRAYEPEEPPPPLPPPRTPGRLWALTAGVAAIAFAAGLAVPYIAHAWPRRPGGPCSANATLLSYSDRLDKTQVENERVSGLSALALTGPAQAMALTDDSNYGPGRVFPISLGSAEHLRPTAERAITLRDTRGTPYTAGNFDGEGLVVEKGTGTMLVSSEIGPSIHRFRIRDGREVGRPLPIPTQLRTVPEGNAQVGRTIEALAATHDGRYLFAGMEAPLSTDGDARGRNLLRIQRYHGTPGGAYEPDRQYAYLSETGLYLVELVALDEDHLVSLERQYVTGLGNAIRAYTVTLTGARDVTGIKSLFHQPVDDFVKNDLLFDLAACPAGSPGQVTTHQRQPNPLLDNVEGMAVGQPQQSGDHKGWRPLYLVSDDNENSAQITRLYALRIRVPGTPLAQGG